MFEDSPIKREQSKNGKELQKCPSVETKISEKRKWKATWNKQEIGSSDQRIEDMPTRLADKKEKYLAEERVFLKGSIAQ